MSMFDDNMFRCFAWIFSFVEKEKVAIGEISFLFSNPYIKESKIK